MQKWDIKYTYEFTETVTGFARPAKVESDKFQHGKEKADKFTLLTKELAFAVDNYWKEASQFYSEACLWAHK